MYEKSVQLKTKSGKKNQNPKNRAKQNKQAKVNL